MADEETFATELRGEEEPMNVKPNGIVPAIVVGVLVAVSNYYIGRAQNRNDSAEAATAAALTAQATALTKLEANVANLSSKVGELAEQPYVRREEFETGVAGLDKRISNVERAVFVERKR